MASGERTGSVVWVGEADAGSTIALRIGAELRVRLRATPSAGYEWVLEDELGSTLRREHPDHFENTDPSRLGASVDQVIRLSAQRGGTTSVCLAYRRVFERDRPPVRTFRIEVRVIPASPEE